MAVRLNDDENFQVQSSFAPDVAARDAGGMPLVVLQVTLTGWRAPAPWYASTDVCMRMQSWVGRIVGSTRLQHNAPQRSLCRWVMERVNALFGQPRHVTDHTRGTTEAMNYLGRRLNEELLAAKASGNSELKTEEVTGMLVDELNARFGVPGKLVYRALFVNALQTLHGWMEQERLTREAKAAQGSPDAEPPGLPAGA